jgi:hypothetical protein
MNIPNFTAEAALNRANTFYQMSGAALQTNGAIYPAYQFPSCSVICRKCEDAGGTCIHLGNGRCACA